MQVRCEKCRVPFRAGAAHDLQSPFLCAAYATGAAYAAGRLGHRLLCYIVSWHSPHH